MSPGKTQLEACADIDIPPRIWRLIVQRAAAISSNLWQQGTVGLRAVDAAAIRELNLRYRSVDETTDVLSFPSGTSRHHGDIALCWDCVERQAAANGNAPEDEALALVCHGLLHLAGYDHDTAVRDDEMTGRTYELCKSAGVEVRTFGH